METWSFASDVNIAAAGSGGSSGDDTGGAAKAGNWEGSQWVSWYGWKRSSTDSIVHSGKCEKELGGRDSTRRRREYKSDDGGVEWRAQETRVRHAALARHSY